MKILTHSDFKNSIIVSHPAQQHSYRLAAALEKVNLLHSYCTTVYYKPDKPLYRLLSRILDQDSVTRMKRRIAPIFEYKLRSFNELIGLLYLYVLRKDKNGKMASWYTNFLGDVFGNAVAKYAIKKNVKVVVAYDRFSLACFKRLKQTNITKILDVSSIPVKSIVDIINRDLPNAGNFADSYQQSLNAYDAETVKRSVDELMYADYFLVASKFVKNALMSLNVDESKILLVRYGVDISRFTTKDLVPKKNNEKLVFLFVGRMSASKGIHYLLEAFKQLDRTDIELKIAGSMMNNEEIFEPYKDCFTYLGIRPNKEMPEIYKSADVFVLPSMHEGAALVIVESLASGLPVIATENCGFSEMLTDGENGFIIPAGNIERLKEKILWFCDHKEKISEMGKAARILAEQNTWTRYEAGINTAFDHIFTNSVEQTKTIE